MDPGNLETVVVAGVLLDEWYDVGLLERWLGGDERWPTLRLGPFGLGTILGEAEVRVERRRVKKRMRSMLELLNRLTEEGIVEPIPAPRAEDVIAESEDDRSFQNLWAHAHLILQEANARKLNVWADDRFIGLLLWQYGLPVVGPEVEAEVSRVREMYAKVDLVSTEMVLGSLPSLPQARADELGWRLFERGYRPLLGHLALRHLLREYPHAFDQAPFSWLLGSAGALAGYLPGEDVLPLPRREGFRNIAIVPVLDALLSAAWGVPDLTTDKREALAEAILDACWDQIPSGDVGETAQAFAYSWAHLFVSMGWWYEGENGERDDEGVSRELIADAAQTWLGNTLARRLSMKAQRLVVRAVEDTSIVLYRRFRENDLETIPEELRDDMRSLIPQLAAEGAWQKLVALFGSPLLNQLTPLLRRLFAFLVGMPEAGLATLTLRDGLPAPLQVTEEEIEQAALGTARQADEESRRLIRLLRVRGYWLRPVPSDDRETNPELPDEHSVLVDVPFLALLLRNEEDFREALTAQLEYGLDLVDPPLREAILARRSALTAEDSSERERAILEVADAAVGSVALDLERDLAHAVSRLRDRSLEGYEAWLVGPARAPEQFDYPAILLLPDQGRMPVAAIQATRLLTLKRETLDVVRMYAESDLQVAHDAGKAPSTVLTALARIVADSTDSFVSAFIFLELLFAIDAVPDPEIETEGATLPAHQWVQRFVLEALGAVPVARRKPLRDPFLRTVHAYALRLAAHASSGNLHLQGLRERHPEDLSKFAQEWASSVLIASARLLGYVTDRHRDPAEALGVLRFACGQLGLPLTEPSQTGDQFNPFLYGPGLVDHECWALLHVLNVSWERLIEGESAVPAWWSDEITQALRVLATSRSPVEEYLSSENSVNGLGMTLTQPPSTIAVSLLNRLQEPPNVT